MPLTAFDLNANHLLAALPRPDRERWRSSLEGVVLGRGQVLHEPGRPLRHAYFPVDAVVSLQVQSNNGGCDEVAIVGHEGMVGVSIFMGGGAATSLQAVVQNPGLALRWSADWVRDEFEGSCAVLRLLLQYVASQDVQLAQGVVCSRHHSIEQRLALRLLVGAKCQRNSKLAMTHEQLAMSLGVRRASVTEARPDRVLARPDRRAGRSRTAAALLRLPAPRHDGVPAPRAGLRRNDGCRGMSKLPTCGSAAAATRHAAERR